MRTLSRILLVATLVWCCSRLIVYLLPGDPADFLVHESLVRIDAETLRKKMDLTQGPLHRILAWPSGESLIRGTPVGPLLGSAFVRSAFLVLLTLAVSIPAALTLSYLHFRNARARQWAQILSLLSASLPLFVLGPLLLRHLSLPNPWLPAFTLSLHLAGFWYRAIAKKLDGFLPRSPVPGARALGFPERRVFARALLAPVLGSLLAYFGTQLGTLLNGSLIVETVFQWKGLGSLLAESILSRDYPVIELCLMLTTFLTLISQQLGLGLQARWEPRIE
jgi:ABC-type dipeptide/oligopeptide/nickel transport system permease component